MFRHRREVSTLGGVLFVAALAAGCTAASSGIDSKIPTTPSNHGDPAVGGHEEEKVSMINGAVPPSKPTAASKSTTLLDVVQDGQRHLVFKDVRPEGTRSPIHEHPFGGATCMESGEMTLYLEGSEPQVAGPGECYWMPPGKPMSGVNTGGGPAVLIDMFTVPDGQPVWRVVEEGQESLQENFDSGNSPGM